MAGAGGIEPPNGGIKIHYFRFIALRATGVAGEQHPGYDFAPADKSPGSRTRGWTMIRERLIACSIPNGMRRRESKGLFVVKAQLRTIPVLPRSKKNPDDADSSAEDHIADGPVANLCRHCRQNIS